MKKTPTKSAKKVNDTPVPAPAPVAKTPTKAKPAKAPAKVAATAKAAKPAKASKKAAAPAEAPAIVPQVKEAAPVAVETAITAQIDVGFGNTLYIRGEGPGLSWDRGLALESAGSDLWAIKLAETARPIVFKFLVNDVSWSQGADYVAVPGTSLVLKPTF